jgi:type I restriction enzyme M protein
VTVERPLRLKVDLGEARRKHFRVACAEVSEEPIANLVDNLARTLGGGPHKDFNAFNEKLKALADDKSVKLTAKRMKLLQSELAERDEAAAPFIKKLHKKGEADPLHGFYEVKIDGKTAIVEYEPDPDLRDTEQVPLLEEGGIAAFIDREVLPHAPDAWVDKDATKVGYEISLNRYFYKPPALRSLEEIRADIVALEQETGGLLAEIVGESRV